MVHQYKCNGYNIVIDGNSGAIHWVDDQTYAVIEAYPNGDFSGINKEDLDEILPEVKQLIEDGTLFSKDPYEEMAGQMKKRHGTLKAICLHVAHACNMDCSYCFAGKGEYHGEKGLMSIETGRKAIDFLVKNSPGRKNLEVDFFGGEPLLNWEMVKETVEYAKSYKEKNFRFTLTTNGLLLTDEVILYSNQEMENVVISLDGRKSTNDAMRHTKDGKGTYDIIMPKFQNFIEKRGDLEYYMRGTYTANNMDFSKDVIHMADMGFKSLAMEPVVTSDDMEYALKEEHLPILFKEYENLAMEMIKRGNGKDGFSFYHYTIDMEGGPCLSKRLSGCGVGQEYMAVTPEGDLYPCHQFVGHDQYKIGNVYEEQINTEVISSFDQCNIYGREECKDCFAKLYCSGGCAANSFNSTGNITGQYKIGCELHKKRLEYAIMMKICERDN